MPHTLAPRHIVVFPGNPLLLHHPITSRACFQCCTYVAHMHALCMLLSSLESKNATAHTSMCHVAAPELSKSRGSKSHRLANILVSSQPGFRGPVLLLRPTPAPVFCFGQFAPPPSVWAQGTTNSCTITVQKHQLPIVFSPTDDCAQSHTPLLLSLALYTQRFPAAALAYLYVGHRGHMWCDAHTRVSPQWITIRQGFCFKDIKQTAAYMATVKCLEQGTSVHMATSGTVDDGGALGQPREQLCIDNT